MIDQLAEFNRTRIGFRALFLEADVTERIHQAILQAVERILTQQAPELDQQVRHQTAVALVAISKGMMKLSDSPDNLSENVALTEVKLALSAYLRAVLKRAGLPLPTDLQSI